MSAGHWKSCKICKVSSAERELLKSTYSQLVNLSYNMNPFLKFLFQVEGVEVSKWPCFFLSNRVLLIDINGISSTVYQEITCYIASEPLGLST